MSTERATCPKCQNPEAGFSPVDGDFWCQACGYQSHPADAVPTVKKVDLFGTVHDTYQTEAELNGWRPTQAPLW